jgi:phosphatidylglycerol:prolipoprotein diacylglycerol transferase
MTELLSISIGLDPNLTELFGLLITWHGVFTAIGIIAGVWLSIGVASSERVGIDPDTAYTIGMIVVVSGIVGARALYVIENYGDNPSIDSVADIFRITEGGISIYGAIIGGAIGGWAYGLWKRLPCAAGADAAAFGMLLGLAIGRIGDIINGEHFAKASDLPWAVVYTHPNSPGFLHSISVGPWHPAVAYELIGDLVILGLLALLWRRRPKSGVIFASAFVLYAIMRFFVSYLRLDSEEPALGLSVPQLVSIFVIVAMTPLLAFFALRHEPEHMRMQSPEERARAAMSRAERRRRLRSTTTPRS